LPSSFRVRGLPLVHFVPILIAIKDPAKKGMFIFTRAITGSNTDQYYLKNQDITFPRGEKVFWNVEVQFTGKNHNLCH
jgi:hypothetical protein